MFWHPSSNEAMPHSPLGQALSVTQLAR